MSLVRRLLSSAKYALNGDVSVAYAAAAASAVPIAVFWVNDVAHFAHLAHVLRGGVCDVCGPLVVAVVVQEAECVFVV
eukprot:1954281-Rhodomonas_salina.1